MVCKIGCSKKSIMNDAQDDVVNSARGCSKREERPSWEEGEDVDENLGVSSAYMILDAS
jgi:hypothetical protein